jgi:hypothetical protein
MTQFTEARSDERSQYLALSLLALGAVAATALLTLSGSTPFQPYLGRLTPLLAVLVVTVLGFVSLAFLQTRGWFEIYAGRKSLQGTARAALLASLLAIAAILVDLGHPFPRDMNVPPPHSLLFYPAIGYVVEITFHALPLALLLASLGGLADRVNSQVLIWGCILIVALLEPILQVRWAVSVGGTSWVDAFVGLQVFVVNLLQLYIFRRYDFVSMYMFRLTYYVQWHILWGYVRLRVLY